MRVWSVSRARRMSIDEAAARVPALRGARNFRDMGGYPAADGRRVRWARVYRSGALSQLTEADLAQLGRFGVRTVCDFRSPAERSREPSRWSAPGVEHLHWDYDFDSVSLRSVLREVSEPSIESMRYAMTQLYRRLPSLFAAPYATLFAKLAQGAVPLIFHCTAGKDRTGIAAALLLSGLGVPREVVVEDYALTNTVVDLEGALVARKLVSSGIADGPVNLRDLAREVRAPLLQARAEYLQAAFDQIERDHGGLGAYLKERLGVTDDVLREIRQHLLEG
jgi:protein-tyrosine phosphatase